MIREEDGQEAVRPFVSQRDVWDNQDVVLHFPEIVASREFFEKSGGEIKLSPEDEFFKTIFFKILEADLINFNLARLSEAAENKIQTAEQKFLAQDDEKFVFSFFSFLVKEFAVAAGASEENRILHLFFDKVTKIVLYEQKLTALRSEQEKLVNVASVDSLTGILNRRSFDMDLPKLFNSEREADQDLALIIFDLDHFKNFNDTYGHIAGDLVLQAVTKEVSRLIRGSDKFYRIGGEEFAILLHAPREEVKRIMDKLVKGIANLNMDLTSANPLATDVRVTISAGGAMKGDQQRLASDEKLSEEWVLFNFVDGLLYKVKKRQNGRNDSFMAGVDKTSKELDKSLQNVFSGEINIPKIVSFAVKEFFLGLRKKK